MFWHVLSILYIYSKQGPRRYFLIGGGGGGGASEHRRREHSGGSGGMLPREILKSETSQSPRNAIKPASFS